MFVQLSHQSSEVVFMSAGGGEERKRPGRDEIESVAK